jgi:chromosomal replication initiation ATPase DnaA
MQNTCTTVWNNSLQTIKANIPNQSYRTWFEPISALKLEGNVLTVQVPSLFFYEWLEEHYVGLLRKTVKQQLGEEGRLEYNIVVDNKSSNILLKCLQAVTLRHQILSLRQLLLLLPAKISEILLSFPEQKE